MRWSASALYSDGVLGVIFPSLPGDANRNGIVDMTDYIVWFNHFGQTSDGGINDTTWRKADFNGDGITDMTDYITWFNYFGQVGEAQSVPEPATMALVALGGLAVLLRRRK
ncbi:MAG: PEP-CTERM sorting domain-containing protein [Phycisphaerae bacterium]